MAPDRPLPIESLLPFNQPRPTDIRSLLQDGQPAEPNSTSQSPEAAEDEDDVSGKEDGAKPKRTKRARACIACRNMKIRCLPVEGQEACSSCGKVNRECIMPGPPRKRQKTVHKVAELEKKINALTDALLAKAQQTESPSTESTLNRQTTGSSSEPSKAEDTPDIVNPVPSYHRRLIQPAFPDYSGDNSTGMPLSCVPPGVSIIKDNYVDVIARGDLSVEAATAMFTHYKENMCATFPFVIIPPQKTAQDIRAQKPFLFLTILTIASPFIQPSAQPALSVELNRQLSERVLFHGEKSMDLAQALILNSQYYMRPRNARDLSFNQYIHCAVLMSLELGLGKGSKKESQKTIEEALEARRTWLACYQGASNVATILRLPTLVQYTAHIDECVTFMKKHGYPTPTDKWLCALVDLTRILEEAAAAFSMDDPTAEVNFLEPRVQYQLKSFERQLETWRREFDLCVDQRLVRHVSAYVNVYIHEIALHQEHNVNDFKYDSTVSVGRKDSASFTSNHIEALSAIMASTHEMLDIYLSLEIDYARTISNLYIVCNTYAMVVLIKLHWFIYAPDSKVGTIFTPELKVNYYLDAMMQKMGQIAQGGRGICAEAFGFIWQKLKMWHMHRSGNFSDEEQEPGSDDTRRQQATTTLAANPNEIMMSTKRSVMAAQDARARASSPAFMIGYGPNHNVDKTLPSSNLNAAYDAASYGNTNWDQFNWTAEEMNIFDVYMNRDTGWMGYLL